MFSDEQFMRLALREAWRGLGKVAPNPMVGAVIVVDEKIVARGHHAKAGEAHAEIVALDNLASRDQAQRATLYVTLEPCSTHGRTPPCTKAIIDAGFARVVYGATDPNPAHQGEAKKLLEQAGITVTTGVLTEKCAAINHAWNHRMKTGMPWVIAKCGMSLDGRISAPGKRWITSTQSRRHAMLFRRRVDAILVGGNTVRCDNPRLTIRVPSHVQYHELAPKYAISGTDPFVLRRVVWTRSKGNIPKESHLLSDEFCDRTIVLENCSLRAGLQHLAAQGISSVLIEGGGVTLGKAFEENLVDEVRFYVAPTILGKGTLAVDNSSTMAPKVDLSNVTCRALTCGQSAHEAPDFLVTGFVMK